MTPATRAYRSQLREDHARVTRRRIVDAASTLFLERGYAAATIDAIAERAGVSRRTVFTAVGSKSAALKLAFDWAIAGDDEPVAIAQRPETIAIVGAGEPATVIAGWMAMNAAINRRVARLHLVVVVAADTDSDAAALLATTDDQRRQGAQLIVDRLVALGGLAPGLEPAHAVALADVLIDPSTYRRLIDVHHWAFDDYVSHLQRIAVATLTA